MCCREFEEDCTIFLGCLILRMLGDEEQEGTFLFSSPVVFHKVFINHGTQIIQ